MAEACDSALSEFPFVKAGAGDPAEEDTRRRVGLQVLLGVLARPSGSSQETIFIEVEFAADLRQYGR